MCHDSTNLSAEGLVIGEGPIPLRRIVSVAAGNGFVRISNNSDFLQKIDTSREQLRAALAAGVPIYGVTTGYGQSCGNRIDALAAAELGNNLIRYHGCGTGDFLPIIETRAAMLCRLVSLAQGFSGVSEKLLQHLAAVINANITPLVPSIGSVGASGDLTPMSYIAAVLQGEQRVQYQGRTMVAAEALQLAGLTPYRFGYKEQLSMLNGTAIMTGIATTAVERSRVLLLAASAATACSLHALAGHARQFHPTLVNAKPHPGQQRIGSLLRGLLHSDREVHESSTDETLQDPYSIRCAPQILGVLADGLDWIGRWVENEINSCNDNPLTDPNGGMLMGGNFYGGHIAFAMDSLKNALATVADLVDRQIAMLVDQRFSRGLTRGLTVATPGEMAVHHGFKAMQITASALCAEAQKNTMPAMAFSRSTESHNQDIVSQGTLAARDASRQCLLVGKVIAIGLLAAVQACEIRGKLEARPQLQLISKRIRALSPAVLVDRPLDRDIDAIDEALGAICSGLEDING